MRTMIKTTIWMLTAGLVVLGCDDAKEDAAKKPTASAPASAGKAGADKGAGPSAAGGIAAATDDAAAAPDDDPLAGIDKRVVRAAALAKKIEAAPEKAGDILDAAGLERDEFEDLIFEISADASLAKQYQAAMVAQTG
jgi:hypothetical protein